MKVRRSGFLIFILGFFIFFGSVCFSSIADAQPSAGFTDMRTAGCFQCHTVTVSGVTYGPGAPYDEPQSPYYIAADLSNIGSILSATGLDVAVNVMTVAPTAGISNMLLITLSSSEATNIVNYLGTLTSGGTPAITTTSGLTIMQSAGCMGCHTTDGKSATGFDTPGGVGPDLSTIGSTLNSAGISKALGGGGMMGGGMMGGGMMGGGMMGGGIIMTAFLNSGLSSELTNGDISAIEFYLGTLHGPRTLEYTDGSPLYASAVAGSETLQETCELCHGNSPYNGVGGLTGDIGSGTSIAGRPASSWGISMMNRYFFVYGFTGAQINDIAEALGGGGMMGGGMMGGN